MAGESAACVCAHGAQPADAGTGCDQERDRDGLRRVDARFHRHQPREGCAVSRTAAKLCAVGRNCGRDARADGRESGLSERTWGYAGFLPARAACQLRGRGAVDFGRVVPDAFLGSMLSVQRFVLGEAAAMPTSVEDALDTMRVVEAAYLSSERGGEPLPVPG